MYTNSLCTFCSYCCLVKTRERGPNSKLVKHKAKRRENPQKGKHAEKQKWPWECKPLKLPQTRGQRIRNLTRHLAYTHLCLQLWECNADLLWSIHCVRGTIHAILEARKVQVRKTRSLPSPGNLNLCMCKSHGDRDTEIRQTEYCSKSQTQGRILTTTATTAG